MAIDLSNPEAEMFLDIAYYAKEGVHGLLRNTAIRIQQQSYYTLGDFFSNVSGAELQAMNFLVEDIAKQRPSADKVYEFFFVLTALLMVAHGHQACKVKDIREKVKTVIAYVIEETTARLNNSPDKMQEIRKQYDIDRKVNNAT